MKAASLETYSVSEAHNACAGIAETIMTLNAENIRLRGEVRKLMHQIEKLEAALKEMQKNGEAEE